MATIDNKIVMGIDASTTRTGWSIFKEGKLIAYGAVEPKSKDWRERIALEFKELSEIIEKHKPSKIYAEDVPLKDGKKLILELGAVQGMLLSLSCMHNATIDLCLPTNWRKTLNMYDGTKEGTKREILKEKAVKMVNEKFNLNLVWKGATSKYSQHDEAEAILIAYSHVAHRRFGRQI